VDPKNLKRLSRKPKEKIENLKQELDALRRRRLEVQKENDMQQYHCELVADEIENTMSEKVQISS